MVKSKKKVLKKAMKNKKIKKGVLESKVAEKRVLDNSSIIARELYKREGKPWFRKRRGLFSSDLGWGWVPISWEGYLAVGLLLLINFLSVFYFNLILGQAQSIIKFLSVFFLSVFIFSVIAIKKTKK